MGHSDAAESGSPEAGLVGGRRPSLVLILLISVPYGVLCGGVTGTLLSYLLRREGVAVNSMANELALLSLPGTLFFLWSPLTDFWLRRKTWLFVSCVAAAVMVVGAFQLHSYASTAAVVLLFASQCVVLLSAAAGGGVMAALAPPEMKTKVSAMHQVGNMGGGALGGGGLIMLSQHVSKPTLGLVAAVVVFLPSLAALAIDEPALESVPGETLGRRLTAIWAEFKTTFLRWSSLPALLLLMSPLGCGAAIGLLPGIGSDYGLSGNQVAWLNGMAGAVLIASGAMLAVVIPGRIDMRWTYSVLGLVNAASIGVLCIGPTKPLTYLIGTSLYLISVGACWSVFTALVLQVVGGAGNTGSCRYAIALSLGNLPIAYMAAVDGLGAKWFGTRGLAGIDLVVSGVVALGFLGWLAVRGAKRTVLAMDEAGVDVPDAAV